MAGVYCARCLTNVKLEQDGQSCSNCGATLVGPPPPPPPAPSDKPPRKPARKAHPSPAPAPA